MWKEIDETTKWRIAGTFNQRRSGFWSRQPLTRATSCVLESLEQRVFLSGNGLAATYWNSASSTYGSSLNFSGSSVSRIDPTINFNWGFGSPSSAISPDTFSARWSGQIAIPTTATYTFYANSDDGVKLWVNGVLVINNWRNQSAAERGGSITLTGGQRYDIRMEYYDNTGSAVAQLRWSSPTIAKTIVPQSVLYSTALPAAPTKLVASATSSSQTKLTWVDNSTNEDGFVIMRSTDGTNFVQIGTTVANATSYADSGLNGGKTYWYRVHSFNVAGASADAVASATTPAAALNLSGSAAGDPLVTLNWTDSVNGETSYLVERAVAGGSFVTLASLPANSVTWTDNVTDGATYTYRVSALGTSGVLGTSLTQVIVPLATPTGLAAKTVAANEIDLTWTNRSVAATSVQVLRSGDAVQYAPIATLAASATSYRDTSAQPGTQYYYELVATAASGNSLPTTAASASTPVAVAAPIALAATAAVNVPKVTLTWTDNSAGQNGYVVERSADGTNFTAVGTAAAGTTSYTDVAHVAAGTSYTYRLRSVSSGGIVSVTAAATTAAFQVFDGLWPSSGKPDLSVLGMPKIYLGYADQFGVNSATDLPNEAMTRATADKVAALGQILVIDIEAWPADLRNATDAQVQSTINAFTQLIGWIRNEQPNLKLGIYGVMPAPMGSSVIDGVPSVSAALGAWQTADARVQALAANVDYIFPDLYTTAATDDYRFPGLYPATTDPTRWVQRAVATITEARQYGKPVYPFLWHRHMAVSGMSDTQLPDELWRLELQVVRQHADGMVLWDSENWDPSASWWQVTQGFLGASSATVPSAPTALSAVASVGKVDLSWTAAATNVGGFTVERSSDGVNFAQIATVAATARSYSDTGVLGGTYYYRVAATDWLADSPPSPTVSARPTRNAFAITQGEGLNQSLTPPNPELTSPTAATSHLGNGSIGGDWIEYAAMDFGAGATTFVATIAVPWYEQGQPVDLHIGSPTGQLIGTLYVGTTGTDVFWGKYFATQSVSVSGAAGVQDLYLVMRNACDGILVDSFKFT